MKKIMIDMDDVLVKDDFIGRISKFAGKKFTEDDAGSYYLQDLLGDKKEAFFEEFKKINMYDSVELMDNVVEVVKKLNENYDVYICTAYIWREIIDDCGIILKQKYDYLREKFPFLDPFKFIFTASKNVIKADIKIDDRIDNLEGGNIKLLYTAYHNKNISNEQLEKQGIIRVNNWLDIKKILLDK